MSTIVLPYQPTLSTAPHFNDSFDGSSRTEYESYRIQPHSRRTVDYFFPKGVGDYHYGEGHPMKPHRLAITNALVIGYSLHTHIDHFFSPTPATAAELEAFHDSDYIDFLSRLTPKNSEEMFKTHGEMINSSEDCPVFTGLFDFCKQYAGASILASRRLGEGECDVAVNWTGGLHHAKKRGASGFCYVNDIVLAIQHLLRKYARVLYIDIDIHHGDGVEEAFYNTNRVLTVSFHKYNGEFFPGTGKLDDNGSGLGKHFALNVPLKDGIDDESYVTMFRAVMEPTIAAFRPSAIVLQCGADSLGCDRLGAFNLSIKAHGECVRFVKSFNLPLLVLGGGGYTMPNVARCWTYETSVLLGVQLPNQLPSTKYDTYFLTDRRLHPPLVRNVENQNTRASLEKIRMAVREKLRYLDQAPSVQMQVVPPDLAGWLEDEEREEMRELRAGRGEERREENAKEMGEWWGVSAGAGGSGLAHSGSVGVVAGGGGGGAGAAGAGGDGEPGGEGKGWLATGSGNVWFEPTVIPKRGKPRKAVGKGKSSASAATSGGGGSRGVTFVDDEEGASTPGPSAGLGVGVGGTPGRERERTTSSGAGGGTGKRKVAGGGRARKASAAAAAIASATPGASGASGASAAEKKEERGRGMIWTFEIWDVLYESVL